MTADRPLTSQEIEDGWRLDEVPYYESYELVIGESAPTADSDEAGPSLTDGSSAARPSTETGYRNAAP